MFKTRGGGVNGFWNNGQKTALLVRQGFPYGANIKFIWNEENQARTNTNLKYAPIFKTE